MTIKNLIEIPATGKTNNQFIGIKIRGNRIEFHYPETYDLSDSEIGLRRDVLAILRTISLAKTISNDQSEFYQHRNGSDGFPVGSYLWIISDYLSYGYYENKEKSYRKGFDGKVNWKKTLGQKPIIDNGNFIYSNAISERNSQRDNLLTEIYNFCVQKAIDDIGWLYNITFDSKGIDYYRLFNKSIYYSALTHELTRTFDDQKRLRLQNMMNIVTGLDENLIQSNEVVYGVDSYDYVYERLVNSFFSNIENIREFYPKATWNLVLEDKAIDSTNLRPDTVVVRKDLKKVYIIDAKYYRYGTTFKPRDLPETTSIQKQITYGEYVKLIKKKDYNEVYSSFILPYSKMHNIHNDVLNNNMEFVGIGTPKWLDSSTEHRRIVAILLDTTYLINNWTSRNEDNVNQLIEIIEEHLHMDC